MLVYFFLAFIAGGFFGIVGMACMVYGPKTNLLRERDALLQRLDFLELEGKKKRFKPVEDPTPKVNTMAN